MDLSECLVERVRNRIPANYLVEEKKMMDGIIFVIYGKMAIEVDMHKNLN